MSLTLGNGFGNYRRPLNLEQTKAQKQTPQIKGGMKADKAQIAESPTIEYEAKAPNMEGLNENTCGPNGMQPSDIGEEPTAPNEPYEVEKGDSLWKIAKRILGKKATNAQILEFVKEIAEKNKINLNGIIHPGDQLNIPDNY